MKHHNGSFYLTWLWPSIEFQLGFCLACVILVSLAGAASRRDNAAGKAAVQVDGPCLYASIPGTAEIVAITPAGQDEYNCPHNPVRVEFNFYPSDSALVAKRASNQRLTVGAGMNPAQDYVAAKGLSVGKRLPCLRKEITKGACTPILYEFPDIDLSDFSQSCFGK